MTVSTHEIETDPNVVAYAEYLSDEAWVAANSGLYVCFVNGALAGMDAQEDALLEQMRAEYPSSPRFFSLVGRENAPVDLGFVGILLNDEGVQTVDTVAFDRLSSDRAWVTENNGKYVCIINGVLVDISTGGETEDKFIKRMETEFPDNARFFAQVGLDELL